MKAIVIGATGATGKDLVNELLNDPDFKEVLVLTRRAYFEPHLKLKEITVDFSNPAGYLEFVKGDIAFSCLGTTLKAAGSKEAQRKIDVDYQFDFAKVAKENGVPVFTLVSSMGANANSKIFYQKIKGELEDKIKELDFKNFLIFRPGPLIRKDTQRFNEKLSLSLLKFFNSLGLLRKFQAITTEKLAQKMISTSKKPKEKVQIITSKMILE